MLALSLSNNATRCEQAKGSIFSREAHEHMWQSQHLLAVDGRWIAFSDKNEPVDIADGRHTAGSVEHEQVRMRERSTA